MGSLQRVEREGVTVWTDELLRRHSGVVVAFSERLGGASRAPFESLNLASHVGDDPLAVDENRTRLLSALGLREFRERLTMADQVHGESISVIDKDASGSGGYATQDRRPVPAADALITGEPGVPLLMCFADCVPIVLVAPGPFVAVVHAGWRGALAGLPGKTARALAKACPCRIDELVAYIGPHIGECCYPVGNEILSQFVTTFDAVARDDSRTELDLAAAVTESLSREGVNSCSIANLGVCTAEHTERFFSHRAERGRTGRHGALACILPVD